MRNDHGSCISVLEDTVAFLFANQCRSWWNATFCGISSESSLFAKAPVYKGIKYWGLLTHFHHLSELAWFFDGACRKSHSRYSTRYHYTGRCNINLLLHNKAFWHLWNIMYLIILWKMEHLLFWSKCLIFHNIFISIHNLTEIFLEFFQCCLLMYFVGL